MRYSHDFTGGHGQQGHPHHDTHEGGPFRGRGERDGRGMPGEHRFGDDAGPRGPQFGGRGRGKGPVRGPGGRGPGGPGRGPGGPGFGPMGGFGGPGFGPGFGPGGFGPGHGPGRRGHGPGRGRRGDVRKAILALLAEKPHNGYQIMEAIADKTEGVWRPSPGSVYPALNLLEDEGLVEATTAEGKKVFALTEAGTAHVAELGEAIDEPWAKVAGPHESMLDLMNQVRPLMSVLQQVASEGSPAQRDKAIALLGKTRRELYLILAEDETASAAGGAAGGATGGAGADGDA